MHPEFLIKEQSRVLRLGVAGLLSFSSPLVLFGHDGHTHLDCLDQLLSLKKRCGADGHVSQFLQSISVLSRLKQLLPLLEVRFRLPLPNRREDLFGVTQD